MVIICIKLDRRRSLPTSQKLKVLEEKIKIYFLNDWASELILSWVQVNVIYFFITKKNTEKKECLLTLQKKVAIGRKFIFRYLFTGESRNKPHD